ncbi:PIN domain-containing protein [Histidinibacterium lentulum]|uniref:PIN domain-containing protein n=2 Tax=Histidinibacterium lentulum TaxID=2480588 RepID=A0A3N2QYU1_9RHOB|nr:PIN domain-containing protein [Histidinibacterium lentulum]
MREVLLGLAREGFFEPRWSERVLEEWARAARRLGPAGEAQARDEIAALDAAWPGAMAPPGDETGLWLRDPGDIHVLASAIAGHCHGIVTLNAQDFSPQILAGEGLVRIAPDALAMACLGIDAGRVRRVAGAVLEEARRLSDGGWEMRALMKKARLPRLGKALQEGSI